MLTQILADAVCRVLEILFERGQIVFGQAGRQIAGHFQHGIVGIDGIRCVISLPGRPSRVTHIHHAAEIDSLGIDCDRVSGHGFLLNIFDVRVDPVRERQDQRDADDADRSRKCREQSTAFLREQVAEAQRERGEIAHGCLAEIAMFRFLYCVRLFKRIRIRNDTPVLEPDDARGILLGQIGIMGHHHHEPIFRNLLQKIQNLNADLRVKRAGRFIRKKNIRIVDKCPRNCDALHLPSGHLVWLFVFLVGKPHLFQSPERTLAPLMRCNTGNRQRHVNIGQNRLMRDQIVTLKNKPDGMVSVGIPVTVLVLSGRHPVDNKVSAVVTVKSADNVQHRRFARPAGAEHRDKFTVAKCQGDVVQRVLCKVSGFVLFDDVPYLKHVHARFLKNMTHL